ncbi:HPP family protein [Gilliamella sp. Pra-s65]|uniref:HPP family protein n=1 Tax=unclassified Gilliamella TaxID=2685620 RepID=UPI00132C0265|nr:MULTISPECIES: HPP family protein [unclassified Gilliamella]MWN89109.1 HPP family protein [Gilliamella sp. Pra-s65]MWP72152.1 HPP family protein [Gilliamella sp. Pra-s52]MWN32924.1 HPP family protein [Gilliamella sp. Pra-s60]MWP30372.1 HPP family protein [Gilliamella sp. Pra-s54]MWP47167.1 HPP family protein [Gilliamella sp. Pas-s27]
MLEKLKGGEVMQPKPHAVAILRGFIGGALGILTLLVITHWGGTLAIMAPFGATCVLLFAVPKSPLAQPRSVIGGHFVSSFIGVLFINLFSNGIIPIALAVGTSIALMQLLRVIHAPAGANPILIMMSGMTDYSFLITPVLVGSVLLVMVALIVNNIGAEARWPNYWLGYHFDMGKRIKKSKKE